ncbi:MAG TPA: LytTR family DNA-binding domain-containing protein [Sphingopyxis sp.]|nr:LytTR family DNA-binding domain-containing protein [Sphingopyxis sp.]
MSEFVVNGPPGSRRDMTLHLGGIAALTLVLVTSGAFDSDDLPLARRLLMFGVISGLLVVQASVIADVARRYSGSSLIETATAAVFSLVTTLLLMTIEVHLLKATVVVPYEPDPLPDFALFLAPFVIPVGALVLCIKWFGVARRDSPSVSSVGSLTPPEPCDTSPPMPALIENWPREPILRIRAADHYLEIWTAGGISLVRGRMQDALRRVSRTAGIQPHRSWWVSITEIDRIERRGRDWFLMMKDGESLPVARGRAAAVRLSLEDQRTD